MNARLHAAFSIDGTPTECLFAPETQELEAVYVTATQDIADEVSRSVGRNTQQYSMQDILQAKRTQWKIQEIMVKRKKQQHMCTNSKD